MLQARFSAIADSEVVVTKGMIWESRDSNPAEARGVGAGAVETRAEKELLACIGKQPDVT